MSRKARTDDAAKVVADNPELHGAVEADYWAVVCLKRGENGLWAPLEQPFPTKDEAETHAGALKEGNQGAVKVMPRMWT